MNDVSTRDQYYKEICVISRANDFVSLSENITYSSIVFQFQVPYSIFYSFFIYVLWNSLLLQWIKMILLNQVMDDHWEKEVNEFGAINVTGFGLLDPSRKIVQDFSERWKSNSISVSRVYI